MFEEAEFLCKKYNLQYSAHLEKSMQRVAHLINIRKGSVLNFKQLVEELFELVDWFPEAKDNIFRLWMNGRIDSLLSNYRNAFGTKFIICQDDINIFLQTSQILNFYADLCLQVVSSEYPSAGLDIIPFPMDKEKFFEYSTGIGTQYTVTRDTARSKITGNEGAIIAGKSLGLPEQAYQLILSSCPSNLLEKKIFFLPYDRFRKKDKLLADLELCKEYGFVTVYFGSLPSSESVNISISKIITLPALSSEESQRNSRLIRKVKHSLIQLISVQKESIPSIFNNLIFDAEELCENCPETTSSLKISVNVLEFPYSLGRESHIAFVLPQEN